MHIPGEGLYQRFLKNCIIWTEFVTLFVLVWTFNMAVNGEFKNALYLGKSHSQSEVIRCILPSLYVETGCNRRTKWVKLWAWLNLLLQVKPAVLTGSTACKPAIVFDYRLHFPSSLVKLQAALPSVPGCNTTLGPWLYLLLQVAIPWESACIFYYRFHWFAWFYFLLQDALLWEAGLLNPGACYSFTLCVYVCVSVCKISQKFFLNFNESTSFWWKPSLWPREDFKNWPGVSVCLRVCVWGGWWQILA